MPRLKKVSCVHDIRKGKEGLPMTLTAHFYGDTGCSLRIMLSPDKDQEAAWLRLEQLIQRTVRDSMMPGCHDVEKFYQDDPKCTCGTSVGGNWHTSDCPMYPEAHE